MAENIKNRTQSAGEANATNRTAESGQNKNSTAYPYGNGYGRCKERNGKDGDILPAGTPVSESSRIEDPTVPNRAHTELRCDSHKNCK